MADARRRRSRLRRLALLLLLGSAAASGSETGYVLVPGESTVTFEARCLGLFSITGRFGTVEGTVATDGSDSVAIAVRIPVRSLKLHSAAWTERLLGPSFFDAARYPEIRFEATHIMRPGPAPATVLGTLRLHGVERALKLKASAELPPGSAAGELRVHARAELSRSDYALGEFAPFVADLVSLNFELRARPAEPAAARKRQRAETALADVAADAQLPAAAAASAVHTFTERGLPSIPVAPAASH